MKPIFTFYGIADRFPHHFPAYVHDHNLCLMDQGRVVDYLHLERISRRKYDNHLPNWLEQLEEEGLLKVPRDAVWVGVNSFVGNSFISRHGRFRLEGMQSGYLDTGLWNANAWHQPSPWEGYKPEAYLISHELAHIGSCLPFYGDFKDNSLLVHFDGGASLGNYSAFLFKEGKLTLIENSWEMSDLSKLFNDNGLGFALMKAKPGQHTSVPGKLMGYAALGTYREELVNWMEEHNFFRDAWGNREGFYAVAKEVFGWAGDLNDLQDPFLKDVAAAIQGYFEKRFLAKLKLLQESVSVKYLYMAGGCALNILANSKILDSGLFKEVFIPPACNDSGLALGAAAMYSWLNGTSIPLHTPYLNNVGLSVNQIDFSTESLKRIGEILMNGELVGVCNGYGEAGPRALGNRSILARADKKGIARKLSVEAKGREWFRPVAPVMLEKNVRKVSGLGRVPRIAEYMLMNFKVLPEFIPKMEGAIHAQNGARIQSVSERKANPFLYDLLSLMESEFGQVALLNTSFNYMGEPIVHTEANALASAQKMELDALVVNGKLLELKKNHALERI